jgi:hypothetical protein
VVSIFSEQHQDNPIQRQCNAITLSPRRRKTSCPLASQLRCLHLQLSTILRRASTALSTCALRRAKTRSTGCLRRLAKSPTSRAEQEHSNVIAEHLSAPSFHLFPPSTYIRRMRLFRTLRTTLRRSRASRVFSASITRSIVPEPTARATILTAGLSPSSWIPCARSIQRAACRCCLRQPSQCAWLRCDHSTV